MTRVQLAVVSALTIVSAGCLAPAAHAAESVTYEVLSPSDNVGVADVEYFDGTRRLNVQGIELPWRTTVQIANPGSLGFDGAEIRAAWYTGALNRFVMVRIYLGDALKCENALDIGNAACYGSTNFSTAIDDQ